MAVEEKDWIMEAREWYEQSLKQAEERGSAQEKLQKTIRLYGMRLSRPLTAAERETLAERIKRIGEDRVDQVMLSFSPEELAAWLSDPNAQ